jgi:hypothetical protein
VSTLVEPGQVYRFVSRDMDLTLVVVSVLAAFDADRVLARVLILDEARTVPGFRAKLGQTTQWSFHRHDPEWTMLRRVT